MRLGSKKISREIKQQLLRDTPRKMRPRRTQEPTVAMTHKTLIESFTQKDFVMYEQLLHQYGTSGRKKEKMLWYLNRRGITDGPCRELAEIRNSDLKLHHKIVQQLRNMWYDLADHKKEKVKSDCELFWSSMATRILRTPKDRSHIHLSSKWSGSEKKQELVQFLDNLWDKQEGKCAITGEPLLLQLGKNKALPNKCSIDRINNSRGYNKDNVWFVAWWVNSMKSDMPLEVFAERIRKLADNLDKVDKKIK